MLGEDGQADDKPAANEQAGDEPAANQPADVKPAANQRFNDELTDDERAMLDFEKKWWRDRRVKNEVIRREFGISPTIYFRRLSTLIDRPEALDYDPILVRTLLRRRDGQTAYGSS
ncbi:DUF3263 domain-containing protein [Corynebacterium auriscanis]|uniref:DUF3263 domain-containing protein n=1 Tax=Corynebacterium auriscanis TaxID=99807 RepID=UPI003CF46791